MMQAPVTRHEAHDVPLNKIESTLSNLSRESISQAVGNGGQAAARSSVMTLVTYAQGGDQADRVSQAIASLKSNLPSRAIILAAQPDTQGAPLTASVALNCQMPHGSSNLVCAEQIRIDARGEASRHLAGVVLPLLLTELPVFVWWSDSLPAGDLVDNLLETSDRALIDSSAFTDPARDFTRFGELVKTQATRTAFSDFNWTRLKPWRELTAQFFDPDQYRPYLDGVQHLEIEYAVVDGATANPVQALLYAGWLASRLGWQTWTGMHQSNGTIRIGLRTQMGAPITLEISPRRTNQVLDWWATSSASWDVQDGANNGHASEPLTVCPGALMRVGIQSFSNGHPATFTILRGDDMRYASTVIVSSEGETQPQRRTPLDTLGESSLLSQQLGIFYHDAIFDQAVQAACVMAASDGQRTRGTR